MYFKVIRDHILKAIKLAQLLGLKQTIRFAASRYTGKETLVTLSLKSLPHPVFVRATGKDINCLWQVFGNHDCHLDLWPPPKVIVDGGAHVGFASVYFSNQFPDAAIIAVEPESANIEIAQKNLAQYSNVRLIQSAIWSKDAHLVIENPEAESWGFRVREVAPSAKGAFMGRSLESFLRELQFSKVDLVKLDIEGAEVEVFGDTAITWLDQNRALIVETHGPVAERTVENAMQRRGYQLHRQGEKLVFTRQEVGDESNRLVGNSPESSQLPEVLPNALEAL